MGRRIFLTIRRKTNARRKGCRDQAAVDRNALSGQDSGALVREIVWANVWTNYADYGAFCGLARLHHIPIRAMNAPAEMIRPVSHGGEQLRAGRRGVGPRRKLHAMKGRQAGVFTPPVGL